MSMTNKQRGLYEHKLFLHRSKHAFLKKFQRINKMSGYQYKIEAPKGHINQYRGMAHKLWFYHKRCKHYFHVDCATFIRAKGTSGKSRSYRCPLCSYKHGIHLNSIRAKRRCNRPGVAMMTHHTAKKIKKNHLRTSFHHFIKLFHKIPAHMQFKLLAPAGHNWAYRGMSKQIWLYHKKCGHFFKKRPRSIIYGNSNICVYCNKHKHNNNHSNYRSNTEFLREVYNQPDNHNHEYVPIDKYKGNMKKIRWIHWSTSKRPHVIKLSPDSFLNEHVRCPCSKTSQGELLVQGYLEHKGLIEHADFIHGFVTPTHNHIHLDFYLPELKFNKYNNGVAIEYDGIQHFKQIKHFNKTYKSFQHRKNDDLETNKYCKKHHIYLIRIKQNKKLKIGKRANKALVYRTLNKYLFPILYKLYLRGSFLS